MNREDFYNIYIPALEKALANDNVNLGFHVMGPEDYLDKEIAKQVSDFIDNDKENNYFFDLIAYYFDAKSHNFPNINGENIDKVKFKIQSFIKSFSRPSGGDGPDLQF